MKNTNERSKGIETELSLPDRIAKRLIGDSKTLNMYSSDEISFYIIYYDILHYPIPVMQ